MTLGMLTIDDADAGKYRFAEWAACVSADVHCRRVPPSAYQQQNLSAALQNDATAVLVDFDEAARVEYCQLALRVQRAGGQALLIAADHSVISSSLNTGLEIAFRPEDLAVVHIAVIMIDKTKISDTSHVKFIASLANYDDPHKASWPASSNRSRQMTFLFCCFSRSTSPYHLHLDPMTWLFRSSLVMALFASKTSGTCVCSTDSTQRIRAESCSSNPAQVRSVVSCPLRVS